LAQGVAVLLAQELSELFWRMRFLLHAFGLDLIQIATISLGQLFRRRLGELANLSLSKIIA
jgi:hypothetical protein